MTENEKSYFRKVKKIEFSSGDSAELFVKQTFDNLIIEKGILTFIIPKKSLYGEAWNDTRVNYWKKYNLLLILDAGKSFKNVLLEASVFCLKKELSNSSVKVSFLSKSGIKEVGFFHSSELFSENNTLQIYKAKFPKSILNKIEERKYKEKVLEGKLGLAIGTNFYSDIITENKLLKGIDIERYKIRTGRYLKNVDKLNNNSVDYFKKPKIIVQRLVAHIENPYPHLKITACYDDEGIVITNTLMSFELDNRIKDKFLLVYLNSKFLSWYAYNFIYARAIRGMDFYNYYIQQIPIPIISITEQEKFIEIANEIIKLSNDNENYSYLEDEIDRMVYELYDLNEDEIAIVEGRV